MSRISDILANVRDTLADETKQRWSDDKLIRHLNSGIKEIVVKTGCLRERLFLELEANAALYDLSEYVIKFLRVQYMNKVISAKTSNELDTISPTWQEDVGNEVLFVTFDNLPEGWLRIYPKITDGLDNVTQNQVYGGLIDITVNEDIYKLPSYGDLEQGMKKYLILHVLKKPNRVTIDTVDEDMEIDSMYDKALEYYISGHILRADTDTQNRSFGAEQLQLFAGCLGDTKVNTVLSSNVVKTRTVAYKGFI